jgi:hypothetical protein
MTTIVNRAKALLVRRRRPDVETELTTYPSKNAVMQIDAEAPPENSASYRPRELPLWVSLA